MKRTVSFAAACACALAALPAVAQNAPAWTSTDPVLQRIWDEGMNRSQLQPLGQALMDSIGPRLTGTPQIAAANAWAIARYTQWGIPARAEQYGTWRGWSRGVIRSMCV